MPLKSYECNAMLPCAIALCWQGNSTGVLAVIVTTNVRCLLQGNACQKLLWPLEGCIR